MGGCSESHSIHCPVKTVVCDCDIGTDHPDVPAKRFNFWLTSIILFNCTFSESVPDGSLQWSSSCLVCVLFCVWCYVCIVVYVLLYSITICPSLGRLLPNLFWSSLNRTHVWTQKFHWLNLNVRQNIKICHALVHLRGMQRFGFKPKNSLKYLFVWHAYPKNFYKQTWFLGCRFWTRLKRGSVTDLAKTRVVVCIAFVYVIQVLFCLVVLIFWWLCFMHSCRSCRRKPSKSCSISARNKKWVAFKPPREQNYFLNFKQSNSVFHCLVFGSHMISLTGQNRCSPRTRKD